MPYIALKAVKFDRSYAIGEVIPEAVIASEMAEKLIRCGVIQKIDEPRKEKTEAEEPPKEKIKAVKQPKKV